MKRVSPTFFRTTSFRLALIHAVLFAGFTIGLLIYLYFSTVGFLSSQSERELRAEVEALANAYNTGGPDRLNQSVIERVLADGPFFYLLLDEKLDRVSGDFSALPEQPPASGEKEVSFVYQRPDEDGAFLDRHARGIIIRLPNAYVLLIAYDQGVRGEIVGRITQAVWTAAPIGLALSLLGGFFVSRSAARRAEALSRTAEAVMAGDLSRRAPTFQSDDEFDRLSVRMNAMLDQIERLMLTTRYSGDAIAHDLRSPLTRLRNRLESALSDGLDADRAEEVLGETIEHVDQVIVTFNAILRLARVEAGDSGKFVPVDASQLGAELAELYGPAAEEASLEFAAEIEPGLKVLADSSLLAQAISNILDNAMKYTPAGGAMTFRTRQTASGDIEFSVTDTGPGIPADQRERVLERFVRLEKSRTQQGSGLGLSLVSAVAERHGGRLELSEGARSPLGPGLRAALLLPPAPKKAAKPASSKEGSR